LVTSSKYCENNGIEDFFAHGIAIANATGMAHQSDYVGVNGLEGPLYQGGAFNP
jgi:hypothetical protein